MGTKDLTNGQRYFVYFLRFLKFLNIAALLLTIVAYCLVMKNGIEASNLDDLEKAFLFLSQFGFALVSIMCILGEIEPVWFIRLFYLMHYWVGRGTALIWLGVQTIYSVSQLVEAIQENADLDTKSMSITGQVCGWILISIGALYVLMGLLCIRSCAGLDKDDDELAVGLMGGSSSKTSTSTNITVVSGPGNNAAASAQSAADAIMLANMALALGMGPDDARKKFTGKDGAKNAEKMVKDRAMALGDASKAQADLAIAKKQAAANAAAAEAAAAANTYAAPVVAGIPQETSDSSGKKEDPSSLGYGGGGAGGDDSDEDVRSRRNKDDDELEAMYYGQMNQT